MSLFDKILKRGAKVEVKTPVSAVAEAIEQVAGTVESFNPKAQATKRHSLDMQSDSVLAKNIRPIVIIWLLVLLTVALFAQCFGIKVDEKIMDTLFWAITTVLVFYFPGRSIEKAMLNKSKK